MDKLLVIAVICCLTVTATTANPHGASTKSRHKRSLLALPNSSALRVSLDLTIPVVPMSNTSTALTFNLPFRFVLPNKKDIEALLITSSGRVDQEQNDLEYYRSNEDRKTVYSTIENILSSFGFDGASCAQRAICEIAQAPIIHNGLLGQVLNLIMIPSLRDAIHAEGNDIDPSNTSTPGDDVYYEALRAGLGDQDCATSFSCPLSLFQFLYV